MASRSIDEVARRLGLVRADETTDGDGILLVATGEIGETEITLVMPSGEGAPLGMMVELGFHGGRDSERLKAAVMADIELGRTLRALSPEAVTEEHLTVGKEGVDLWIPTAVATDALQPAALQAVLCELARAVSGGPALERTCNTCHTGGPTPLERWMGKTVRMCQDCRKTLTELFAEASANQEGPKYTGPDVDPRSFRARLEPLRASYAASPGRYQLGLVGWVILGQSAMLIFSATLVLAAITVVALIVGLVVVARSGAIFALKGALAKAIKLAVVAIVAACAMVWNLVKSLAWRPKPEKDLYEVKPAEAPRFFAWLGELAAKVGGPAPDVLVIDDGLNASAAEVPLGFGRYRRVVTLGVPVLEMFDAGELEAILGHELGHLCHHDSRSTWVYRTAQAWVANYEALADEEGAGAIVRNFTNWYVPAFFLRAQVVRRQKELEADDTSVQIASKARVLASLAKVHVIGRLLGEAQGAAARESCRESPEVPADIVDRWCAQLAALPPEKFAKAWKDALDEEPHWLDSHPNLPQRLAHIGVQVPDTFVPELAVKEPAGSLIDGYEKHRAHIVGEMRKRLAPVFRFSYRSSQHAARKAELLARQLETAPDSIPLAVELARAVVERDEPERAEAMYRAVIARDAEHWDARRELVDVLAGRERWAEASTLMEPLVARFPKHVDHLMAAVGIHENAGRFDHAHNAIANLLGLDPPADFRAALEEKSEKLDQARRKVLGGGRA